MADASPKDPTGGRPAEHEAWRRLGIPDDVLPVAVAAFHTPDGAKQWIEVLNRFVSRRQVMVAGTRRPQWMSKEYLHEIAVSGLRPEDFVRWQEAGGGAIPPSWSKKFMAAGLGPDDVKRWKSAWLDLNTLPPLLPYLNADLTFEEALSILINWKGARKTEPTHPRADELRELLSGGLLIDELRRLIAGGFSGHELYQWHRTGIPPAGWSTWKAQDITPDKASKYHYKGVAPHIARQWIDTGLSIPDAFAFIDLEASPAEAAQFTRSGVGPESLTRTDAGLEVIEEERPWDEDPVTQLPRVIEPGRISFTIWPAFVDGAYDISFTWYGRREADWWEDISMANGNFSPASSSPITGAAAWPNGRDVELTYEWSEMGKKGEAVLVGAAPTKDDPDSDEGARDPQQWIRLGEALLEFIYQEMG